MRMSIDQKNVATANPDKGANQAHSTFSASKYITRNVEDVLESQAKANRAVEVDLEIENRSVKSMASILEDDDEEFDEQQDLIADLYELEFGTDIDGPVVFGEAPDVVTGHLD